MRLSSNIGRRSINEDDHAIHQTPWGEFFAVCDGHGLLETRKSGTPQTFIGQECSAIASQSVRGDLPAMIQGCNYNTERAFKEWCEHVHQTLPTVVAGTTIVFGFFEKLTHLFHVGTVGDSKTILFRKKDGMIFPIPLSPETHWGTPEAIQRVQEILSPEEFALWISEKNPKRRRFPPGGGVNTSDSLGDKLMNMNGKTAINHLPMCSLIQLRANDLVIMACDGVWDVTTSLELIQTIIQPNWNKTSEELAQLISDFALHTKHSRDNVTVLAIQAQDKNTSSMEDDLESTQEILAIPDSQAIASNEK